MTHLLLDQAARRDRLRVIMLVTGFPDATRPDNGIFNLRAAKSLNEWVDLKVIYLRAWKPGRRIVEFSNRSGIPVLTLAVPQIPSCEKVNLGVYRIAGWAYVRSLVEQCDIIHSVDLGFAGLLGSAWSRWANVRHVTQVITEVSSSFPRGSQSRSAVKWQNHVHAVACNSRLLASQISEVFPQVRNVRTVYRGVDLKIFHPNGSVASQLAGSSSVRFLYLGGFPSYRGLAHNSNTKGGETLIEAWRAAEARLLSTGASLCVAGPDSDCSKVVSWRAGLKQPDGVSVVGRISPEAVPDVIRSSDVVLIPSLQEGLPNVAVEAAACGRAVFGSDTGGIPEVIINGDTGLILPAGNLTAWQHALTAYASKVDELRCMGAAARHRMEMLFNGRNYGPSMLDLYTAALREPTRAEH